MAVSVHDVLLPLFMIICTSPVAVAGFRGGVPIELIVFGLLLVGYKGPHWLRRCRGARPDEPVRDNAESASNEPDSPSNGQGSDDSKAKKSNGKPSWRANLPSWRGKNKSSSSDASDVGSWRRAAAENKKNRQDEKKEPSKSALSFLKKDSPEQKWRSIINKFTPEKFDKLCEQLLETLPKNTESNTVNCEEYSKMLDGLLALIFDASSRQHQYTEMYTNLCSKLLEFVATQQPDLDGRGAIWGRCQQIFLTVVLKTPEFPADLPEDEYMDKKAKHKHMMVGMVKFGGDLVSHGLVPVDGVMHWIHALLSEKHLRTDESLQATTPPSSRFPSLPSTAEAGEDDDGEELAEAETGQEKELEEREVQLEVLCAILASMGSSLNDRTTWSEENRLVIEDVFQQLEQLSMDTKNLSTRMRCLIRDILDLRMAQWKEKEGKLKPTMLLKRDSDDKTGLRSDAPEFCPGADGKEAWKSDRVSDRTWLDPLLLETLQVVEHHLEVIDDKESKLSRLKALIQLYHFIQEQQLVIVANSGQVQRVVDLISESFKEVDFKVLDFSTSEAVRRKHIKSFEDNETSIVVMASEISTRRDFDFKPPPVLINFDFPMTLQLYLYRIHKRAESKTHVYTFFSSQYDVRHTSALVLALEAAKQKVPAALQKLKDQIKPDSKDGGNRDNRRDGRREDGRRDARTPKASESSSKSASDLADDDGGQRGEGGHPWKAKSSSEVEGRRDRDNRDRDDRGNDKDRFHTGGKSDTWDEDRPPRDGKGGKGERRDARPDGNWRDGKEREETLLGSPTGSRHGDSSSRHSDDQQVRRRDTARKGSEQGGEQRGERSDRGGGKGGTDSRRPAGKGGGRDGDDRGTTDAGERRRPWSETDGSNSRSSGQAVGSGQRFERQSSNHGEGNSERWSADPDRQNSSSSTVRQRRSDHHDSSHADGDGSRRPRGDGGGSGHGDRGHRGGDKQGERLQPGSVKIHTRGGNEDHGHRRGNRQGDSRG